MVRAFVSQSVDLGFISQVESYQKTFKNGIHSFPAWRPASRDSVKNKPASLLVVSLGKAWDSFIFLWQTGGGAKQFTYYCGPGLSEDLQTDHERYRCVYTFSCIMLITNSSNDEEEELVAKCTQRH